jgi:hypothetical protein
MKYIALTTIDGLNINYEEIHEAAAEFGCTITTIGGHNYLTATTAKVLANCMFITDLPGAIVEVTGIYDSSEEVMTTEVN